MRAIFGLVLIVGMGLAGFAVYMVKGYMDNQQMALKQERMRAQAIVPTVEVYAVNREIGYGELLTPEDVQLIRHTEEFLPEGTFASEEALFPDGPEVARSVVRTMLPFEPITPQKVTAPGETAGITQALRPGMRAFTIEVDVRTGVSGFLRPGDRVDIYWTGLLGNAGGAVQRTEETHLIGRGIELIAVDQSTDINRAANTVPRTVTVQVAPMDVASLTQAQSSGAITLALVGMNDEVARVTDGEAAITMPKAPDAPAVVADAPAPQEEACFITQRRGTEQVQIPITCN